MFRLSLILHLFIGSTIAGSAMIAVLTMGYDTMTPVMWSALIGFVVSFPLSYLIAKKLYESGA
ncbi:MAG: DUF4229 domain-containing protein [Rhodobacteraceae bacterium]|nr:DUF4229 domain-containing protein [Paracoccaceae bacterium]